MRPRSYARWRRSWASTSTALTGTGPQGRVTEEDVRSAAGSGGQAPEGRREPLRGVRRVIAEHMARAHREVPPVTWVEECDFEAVDMEKLVATVVKACADELQAFPELNARLDRDAIVYLDRYDIGVAVQTAQGLMVPVVRGCDAKTRGRDPRGARFARRTRARRCAGTGGAPRLDVHRHERRQAQRPLPDADRQPPRGGDPLHRPHRAPGRCARREVVVRRMGTIALTFDHRVIDGARAAEFGLAVIARSSQARRGGMSVVRAHAVIMGASRVCSSGRRRRRVPEASAWPAG